MLTRRAQQRRGRSQAGQTLVLALAFIAFFVLTIGAVLKVEAIPGLQHRLTETTASTDAAEDGGAAYAAAEAARTDVDLTCAPGNTGQLTMKNSGHQANYSVSACNPSGSTTTNGAGQGCLLCLLNQVSVGANPAHTPATVVYTANRGVTTTGGNDFINGSVASGNALTATPGGAKIFLLNGASSCGGCSPGATSFAPALADPLSSLGAPSTIAGQPTGCPSWNATSGCTASYAGNGTTVINPGLWASLSVTGNRNLTLNAGTYVFTGQFMIAGNGFVDGTKGVTLYLACPNYGPAGNACPSSGPGRTGGSILIPGKGSESFTAPSSLQYKGVSILADPNLLDPGGTTGCLAGSGCALDISGNGASISGAQDLRSAGADFLGNGGETVTLGRFIANSLFIGGSGSGGLNLSGTGVVSTSNCGVFDDAVSSTGGLGTGRAVIQSQCGSTTGVIDFNYSP